MTRTAARWPLLLLLFVLAGGCGDGDGAAVEAPRPVTLALDFSPNAVHAGVYTAAAERLDRERGIALRIRAPAASADSLKLLTSRRADLAIVDIHDLGLARERGTDVVAVGAVVERPLSAVIAGPGVTRPRQLEGRRVGVTGVPSDDAVLRAVVAAGGGDPDEVRTVTIGFSAVPALIAGRVDAATAFWNAEGVVLRRRGVKTTEFRVGDFGAPRYPELVLVARRSTLERERPTVEAALAALRAGTEAALKDRAAAAARVAKASQAHPELVEAQLEAVAPALRGAPRLDRAAVEAWARFDRRFGVLERRPDVDRAFEFELTAGR